MSGVELDEDGQLLRLPPEGIAVPPMKGVWFIGWARGSSHRDRPADSRTWDVLVGRSDWPFGDRLGLYRDVPEIGYEQIFRIRECLKSEMHVTAAQVLVGSLAEDLREEFGDAVRMPVIDEAMKGRLDYVRSAAAQFGMSVDVPRAADGYANRLLASQMTAGGATWF